jgi:hypothetical protein
MAVMQLAMIVALNQVFIVTSPPGQPREGMREAAAGLKGS